MRSMMRMGVAALGLALGVCGAGQAQFVGQQPPNQFRDVTILRPPAGSKVAILVWEDLGCPACARWFPYEAAAAEKYHVTLLRRDFPLAAHVWTQQAAIDARYLQDHVSPQVADQYRADVFKSQMSIGGKDDLQAYTDRWFKSHNIQAPFVLDPGGKLAGEVQADFQLGEKLNVNYTPTVVVATRNNYQIVAGTASGSLQPEDLDRVVAAAVASVKNEPATSAARPAHRK